MIFIKRSFLFFLFFYFVAENAQAYVFRNLLESKIDSDKLEQILLPASRWVPFPVYTDREGWDKLLGNRKVELIRRGEVFLNYSWKVITLSDYLEYRKSGSRAIMEDPYNENNCALRNLVMAELAEGKGRFVPKIADGIWFYCEMTTWALSAHVDGLPDYHDNMIDLGVGDTGSFLAWTYYFLKNQLDKIQPFISQRLRSNLQRRILSPYLDRSDFWWQAFHLKPGSIVNNWNPWCNCNVLECFILLEEDPHILASAVYRTMCSVDQYLNYIKDDGACEEGTSYWDHAAGKLYDYLDLLNLVTGGKVTLFNEPLIRKMGEYISRSYIGNDWVVNFADASAKSEVNPYLVYSYGRSVGSMEMQRFASYLMKSGNNAEKYEEGHDIYRTLRNCKISDQIRKTTSKLTDVPFTWYPETQVCYLRTKSGLFFAGKGGNNNESHNHNDVGTFLLYKNLKPVFIDIGVGVYTRKTFSKERYSIWTMQSSYHNLPSINGYAECYGSNYHAENVRFDYKRNVFSLDIAPAYPKEASVKYWYRTYSLSRGGLRITDRFELNSLKNPNSINFMTSAKPMFLSNGCVEIKFENTSTRLIYDPSQFKVRVDKIPLTDKKLSDVWGESVYRISLTSKHQVLSGKYQFIID